MKCKECGYQNRNGVNFCESCGERLDVAESGQHICSQCNYQNRAGIQYCENCGAPIVPSLICANCGFSNPPRTRFCGSCGGSMGQMPHAQVPVKRSWVPISIILAAGAAVCLVVGVVAFILVSRQDTSTIVLDEGETEITFQDYGDFSQITPLEVEEIGKAVMTELYPELDNAHAVVTEKQVNGERILSINYQATVQAEGGSFQKFVIVDINTDDQTITIAESD